MGEEKKSANKSDKWGLVSFVIGILTVLLLLFIYLLINSSIKWWKYDILEAILVLASFLFPISAIACGIMGLIKRLIKKGDRLIFSLIGIIIGILGIIISISFGGAR